MGSAAGAGPSIGPGLHAGEFGAVVDMLADVEAFHGFLRGR
jgi:hypothetical protein